MGRQRGKRIAVLAGRLEGGRRDQFLQHQARRIDHEVMPVDVGQVLGFVELLPPAGKSVGQGFVVDPSD